MRKGGHKKKKQKLETAVRFGFWQKIFGPKPQFEFNQEVISPNGRVRGIINLKSGHLTYRVEKDGKILVANSRLSLKLKGESEITEKLFLVRTHHKTCDEYWETIVGEQQQIRDRHNEKTFYLAEMTKNGRLFTLRMRVFDDGIAFRYEIPPQPRFQQVVIEDEMTEFNLELNGQAWQIPAFKPDRYEYNYNKTAIHDLSQAAHTPLTIETAENGLVAIHEAALYDYGAMTLKLNKHKKLEAEIVPLSDGSKAHVELPFSTPWRVIMLADAPIELTTNRMVLNLNDPPSQKFDFVKPLKFLGIWWAMFVGEWTWATGARHGATTEHAKEYIEACNRLGIKGLLVEGWNNGWSGDWLENGKKINFLNSVADFNLDEVAKYANEHQVQLIGHHETVGFIDNYEQQMERAYQFYQKHGLSYVQMGYTGTMMEIYGRKEYHHSQLGVKHYQRVLEMAAKYQIMLNVHEPIKGTGIERTWPNLLTREGARGQEYEGGALLPSHACILPFTRLLAGGMDYTPGIFDLDNAVKKVASTLARQLAYYVTIYSGMQMAADRPRFYEESQPSAYRFIREVPMNWEYTVPLVGKIGEYFVTARKDRDSDDWYIGGVTNEKPHRVKLKLNFLDAGEYAVQIYRDGDAAHYLNNQMEIVIETCRLTKTDILDIWMAPGGGFAVKLTPI